MRYAEEMGWQRVAVVYRKSFEYEHLILAEPYETLVLSSADDVDSSRDELVTGFMFVLPEGFGGAAEDEVEWGGAWEPGVSSPGARRLLESSDAVAVLLHGEWAEAAVHEQLVGMGFVRDEENRTRTRLYRRPAAWALGGSAE